MRRLLLTALLLITGCTDTVGSGGTVVELHVFNQGFDAPQVEEWQLIVRPMRNATFAEAEAEGVTIGGQSCEQILEAHPTATGCVEQEYLQIDWDTQPLVYDVSADGEAFIDTAFADPVFVSVTHPTAADSLCDWNGSERLTPGTTRLIVDVGVACE